MPVRRHLIPTLVAMATVAICSVPASAVVNGTKVDAQAFPWYVGVGNCGGTMVTPDRVLTAAHCVKGRQPSDLGGVRIGDQTRLYTRFAMHPNWRRLNGTNYLDDVAIVELSAPIAGTPTIVLGGRDSAEAWILGQGRHIAPGGGQGESAATYDTSLRLAPLKSLSDEQCATLFRGKPTAAGELFDKRMRCSIDADGHAPLYSGCFGDSGGPLFTGSAAAPVQLGVVSWGGDRCGADHLPSVFADVARYRAFILAPAPVWAPTHTGTVVVKGTAKAGQRLSCAVHDYVPEPGAAVVYEWRQLPNGGGFDSHGVPRPQKKLGSGRRYTVTRRDGGHRVACSVSASNAGGYVQVGVASKLAQR